MNKIALLIAIIILLLGLAFSTVAAYRGAGLVASGTGDTSSRSAVWFPVFVGGGPGGGK